jgi:hypothetical protein
VRIALARGVLDAAQHPGRECQQHDDRERDTAEEHDQPERRRRERLAERRGEEPVVARKDVGRQPEPDPTGCPTGPEVPARCSGVNRPKDRESLLQLEAIKRLREQEGFR